ncbi:ATP-binding cassette domain-containing protein [Bradyrhizobium iriomotense]|uniref:ABC transporter domain-containing protein n=1 Tax=Bradyrhizobium iriomotense TaxID=441950 RepID=A0ABQ6B8C6_9BRAD|nr:ATP-binding cassette domain-containing protein [Bradyrhizobium iriomotense]GLR90283.1 hypothetical protein GCM10007857_69970 [Bradyrhizobium iriomotense]
MSLDIRDGEFLTLVGPSGCGKSTLPRLIAGRDAPDSGSILIDERVVDGQRRSALVAQAGAAFRRPAPARRARTRQGAPPGAVGPELVVALLIEARPLLRCWHSLSKMHDAIEGSRKLNEKSSMSREHHRLRHLG